ncbi:hypothetical protein CEXT_418921 [Caerostris extrusa]|uniref:Uncharacterized protein n=1 Tax=Caerostris extrusa TaxID=172846 RepID=A0AAV4P921_CAEEX|nr:hypothetical protein CEXT_418921 [Caerostris extrusa]
MSLGKVGRASAIKKESKQIKHVPFNGCSQMIPRLVRSSKACTLFAISLNTELKTSASMLERQGVNERKTTVILEGEMLSDL